MMLRKMGTAMLCVTLAVCMLVSSAMAADTTILQVQDNSNDYRYPLTMAAVGDTLFVLCNTSEGYSLYQWKDGMEDAELVTDALVYGLYYTSEQDIANYAEQAKEESGRDIDVEHAVGRLTAYGDKLLSINNTNGKVFTIEQADGGVTFEDVVTLKDISAFYVEEEDYTYSKDCVEMISVGDKLLYMARVWTDIGVEYQLYVIDLKTGDVALSKLDLKDIQELTSYKDGKALLIVRDEDNAYDPDTDSLVKPSVYAYDPETDTAEKLGELDMDYVSAVTYAENFDALLWLDNCRIMGTSDFVTAKQYAYVPVSYSEILVAMGDSIAVYSSDVYIRTLTENFNTESSLTVYGSYMDSGSKLFTEKYPQVPVYSADEYYSSLDKLSQAMLTGDNSLDLLTMTIEYSNFTTLMNKGYCADLSGDAELMAYVDRLYPVFKDAVMKDGKLYAIPLSVYSSAGWYVATGVMEEMGLTYDDLPTNFVDLCAFATKWNDEWVEEYPQFTLLEYTSDYKTTLFNYMIDNYLQYCTAKGQDVKFDSVEFRAMMEALEAMRADELSKGAQESNEDEVGYRQGLFMPYYSVVGNFSGSSEYRQFVPMTLTADSDYVTGVSLEVAFINPKTKNLDLAIELLKCKIEALSETDKHTLLMDETEPVVNANYERVLESEQKYLDNLKKQLEEADEADKKEIQSWIDSEEQWLENYTINSKYSISEEAIRFYTEEIAPTMFVMQPTFRAGTEDNSSPELDTLIERYLAGQINLEQFIKNADSKMMMMQLENQ